MESVRRRFWLEVAPARRAAAAFSTAVGAVYM